MEPKRTTEDTTAPGKTHPEAPCGDCGGTGTEEGAREYEDPHYRGFFIYEEWTGPCPACNGTGKQRAA